MNRTHNWSITKGGEVVSRVEFTGRYNKVKAIRRDMAVNYPGCVLTRVRRGAVKF